jgi:peptidoglycan/xylan/chitin deacetylase (PgdA/CDA1 family)
MCIADLVTDRVSACQDVANRGIMFADSRTRSKIMIRLPILRYHHVVESLGLPVKDMGVSPNKFEQQMSFLSQKGYRCLNLSDVIANLQEGNPQPERSFVLTFDDGYFDIYENAFPVLKKFGFNATVFVVAEPVEDSIKGYLSWQQMRELTQNQFTFGSHTLTHPRLPSLDTKTIGRELDESKKVIEDRLGEPVDLLAYPYGESNERIRDMAHEIGYHAACGMTWGQWGLFNLWRAPVYEHDNSLTFHWKANGGYSSYNLLIKGTYIGNKMRVFKRNIKRGVTH